MNTQKTALMIQIEEKLKKLLLAQHLDEIEKTRMVQEVANVMATQSENGLPRLKRVIVR